MYVENCPLSLKAHIGVENFNYLKIYVCFSVLNNVENVILNLSVRIAEWREQAL